MQLPRPCCKQNDVPLARLIPHLLGDLAGLVLQDAAETALKRRDSTSSAADLLAGALLDAAVLPQRAVDGRRHFLAHVHALQVGLRMRTQPSQIPPITYACG